MIVARISSHSWMRHCDYDISLLVPLLNVLEGFGYLLQRISSVDDRLELPSRRMCGDETHVRHVSDGHTALDPLSDSDGGPQHPIDVAQLHDVLKKNSV